MKTKLFILILLMVGSLGMGKAHAESATKYRPPVRLVIKLFKSRTGCTEPRGICTELFINSAKISDPNLTACDVTYEFNTLTIQVPKLNLNESARKSLVGFSTLPIDADFTFSIESSRALGSMIPITIKVGDYPIRETIDGYTITFPCK